MLPRPRTMQARAFEARSARVAGILLALVCTGAGRVAAQTAPDGAGTPAEVAPPVVGTQTPPPSPATVASPTNTPAPPQAVIVPPAMLGTPAPPQPVVVPPAAYGPAPRYDLAPQAYGPAPRYDLAPPAVAFDASQAVVVPRETVYDVAHADHGRRLERVGLRLGTIGMVSQLVGAILIVRTSASCVGTCDQMAAGAALYGLGLATAIGGNIIGGSGALMVSRSLRRLGIGPDHRGLAIASLATSFIPFAGGLVSYIFTRIHYGRTRPILDSIQVVRMASASRPRFFSGALVDARTQTYGSTLGLSF